MSACRSVVTSPAAAKLAPPTPSPGLHAGLPESRPSFRLELAQDRFHGGEVRVRDSHRPGAGSLVGNRGGEESQRGGGPRRGRHHHLAHPELAGDPRGVKRPRAAHRHHRVPARIAALLDDVHAGGAGHVLAHEVVDAPGRLGDRESEVRGEPGHRGFRGGGVEGHPATQEITRIEKAEEQVRVGHRGLDPALSVAGGAGLGTRALGTDLEQAQFVDPCDRSAPCPDLHHVDDRGMHRQSASPLEPVNPRGLEHRRDVGLAVLNEGRLGRRAPHVEGQEVRVADCPTDEGARLRAAGGARFEEANGKPFRRLRSGEPSGGLDEMETPPEAALAQDPLEPADIGGHEGLHVGVRGGGRRAFVLVDLGMHVARDRYRQRRKLVPDEIPDHPLVHGVLVGVEEAHRERLDPAVHQLADLAAHGGQVDSPPARRRHGSPAPRSRAGPGARLSGAGNARKRS